PTRVAEDVLLTGRSLTADDGLRLGIVSLVVPEGGLDEAVDTFVDTHFVPRSAHSLRLATRAARGQRQVEVGERLDEAERLYVEELLPTHDGVEGIRAFMEKRPPQWRNC
ncbi:MAG TPA: enoyl-CoA hydratase-related protein, partial [Acidimicrobiales bacterium]|nr:enoyl-CoA hydratase-related protein [Acidimicrobiales bacterium]